MHAKVQVDDEPAKKTPCAPMIKTLPWLGERRERRECISTNAVDARVASPLRYSDARTPCNPESAGFTLHDDGRHVDIGLDALVREDAPPVDVNLIPDRNIVTQDADVL